MKRVGCVLVCCAALSLRAGVDLHNTDMFEVRNTYSVLALDDDATGYSSAEESETVCEDVQAVSELVTQRRSDRARRAKKKRAHTGRNDASDAIENTSLVSRESSTHKVAYSNPGVSWWKTAMVMGLLCVAGQGKRIDEQSAAIQPASSTFLNVSAHEPAAGESEVKHERVARWIRPARPCRWALSHARSGDHLRYLRVEGPWQHRSDRWADIRRLGGGLAIISDHHGTRLSKVRGVMQTLHEQCCRVLNAAGSRCDRLVWRSAGRTTRRIFCNRC